MKAAEGVVHSSSLPGAAHARHAGMLAVVQAQSSDVDRSRSERSRRFLRSGRAMSGQAAAGET
eukprot:CAMPEP_0204584260 /NCGR_PEP_ID=MMETSP0661-20131031/46242_1 /ASSEMBLY_ACC=CAM_ASM_000606 /TAXON_ID=109239 /ORGANISM="Alexandrium margalefi, Strain AMGDE01CS-322" /LENGTH=62 /DNA_ID=CAMNT_0051593693 /DNA_START=115 /DNA_END=303 /DNA_ORIENTATION=-